MAHSVEQARASDLFAYVAVSSDSAAILDAARAAGADLLIPRPDDLASDAAAKIPVIKHAATFVEAEVGHRFDTLADLDATSPLRIPDDIIGAVSLLEERGVSQVITGMRARHSPYFNLVELNDEGYVSLSKPTTPRVVRRQDAPRCYDMNASVYVWTHEGLFQGEAPFNRDTLLYEMPESRSVDIDSPLDADFVRFLYDASHPSIQSAI